MTIFCDTSALYAVAAPADKHHAAAAKAWMALLGDRDRRMVTTNYVIVETLALAQHRQGLRAVRLVSEALEGNVEVSFVDADLHRAAVAECLRADQRELSLVDHVSFTFMRRHGIRTAFAFDEDFVRQGFASFAA